MLKLLEIQDSLGIAIGWLQRNPAEAALGVMLAASLLRRLGWTPAPMFAFTRAVVRTAQDKPAWSFLAAPAALVETLLLPLEAALGIRLKKDPEKEASEKDVAKLRWETEKRLDAAVERDAKRRDEIRRLRRRVDGIEQRWPDDV